MGWWAGGVPHLPPELGGIKGGRVWDGKCQAGNVRCQSLLIKSIKGFKVLSQQKKQIQLSYIGTVRGCLARPSQRKNQKYCKKTGLDKKARNSLTTLYNFREQLKQRNLKK